MNKKIIILLLTGLWAVVVALGLRQLNTLQISQDVRISEICSKNDRVIYNKSGSFNDYIELYNPTSQNISFYFTGLKISNNKHKNEKRYNVPKINHSQNRF